jgi:hypothetical protein
MSSKDIQLNKFKNNIITFLDDSKEIVSETYQKYPKIKGSLSITPDLIDLGMIWMENYSLKDTEILLMNFISTTYQFWDKIETKDNQFLGNSLSLFFPDNNYIKDLSFFFGNNKDKKIYVDEDILDHLWDILKGLIHNSLKYIYFSKINVNIQNFNLQNEITKWKVNINV